MTPLKKFLFDTPFAPDGRILEQSPQSLAVFTVEDMEAACATARHEATLAAREEMGSNATRQKAQALASLGASMRHALAQIDEAMEDLHRDAAELAFISASALAGKALESFGVANAKALLESALEDLKTAPQVRLRVSQSMMHTIGDELGVFSAELGATDRIEIVEDGRLSAGDIQLDFPGGGIARRRDDILAKIQLLLTDHSTLRSETP
jgi:hypothetical protein